MDSQHRPPAPASRYLESDARNLRGVRTSWQNATRPHVNGKITELPGPTSDECSALPAATYGKTDNDSRKALMLAWRQDDPRRSTRRRIRLRCRGERYFRLCILTSASLWITT